MLVYIVSDVNKSLGLEWVFKKIKKKIKIKVVLINCKNTKLEEFLIVNNIEYKNLIFKRKYLHTFSSLFKLVRILYIWKATAVHCHLRKASVLGILAAYLLRVKKNLHKTSWI